MSDDKSNETTNTQTNDIDKVTDTEQHEGFLTPERVKEAEEEREQLKKDA